MKPNNYINHICLVVDASGSMRNLRDDVVSVINKQVKLLADQSVHLDQETRVSIYQFNDKSDCLVYDKDVMRLPDIDDYYECGGQTALMDAAYLSIGELSQTPELHGDHSFLVFVITDGGENASHLVTAKTLGQRLNALKDNWTVAVLVPDQTGAHFAKSCGFPAQNVQIWDTSKKGLDEAFTTISTATTNFMQNRKFGVRGTKTLFNLKTDGLNTKTVKTNLVKLNPSEYELLNVNKTAVISEFVESWKIPYIKGCAYYQLTKPETVQAYKQICVQEKSSGKVFSGENARRMLNLPDHEVRVSPANFSKWEIFLQSTSSNRKLVAGTKLIVIK